MNRDSTAGALVALICLTVFAAAFIIYTTQYLPSPVATHFSVNNRADGWMSRNAYLAFILGFLIGVPAIVSFVVGALPQVSPVDKRPQSRLLAFRGAPRRVADLSIGARHALGLPDRDDDGRHALHDFRRQSHATAGAAAIDLLVNFDRLCVSAALVDRPAVSEIFDERSGAVTGPQRQDEGDGLNGSIRPKNDDFFNLYRGHSGYSPAALWIFDRCGVGKLWLTFAITFLSIILLGTVVATIHNVPNTIRLVLFLCGFGGPTLLCSTGFLHLSHYFRLGQSTRVLAVVGGAIFGLVIGMLLVVYGLRSW